MIAKPFIPWLFAFPPPALRPAGAGLVAVHRGLDVAAADRLHQYVTVADRQHLNVVAGDRLPLGVDAGDREG